MIIGLAVVFLIALIPTYLFFNHAGAKEQQANQEKNKLQESGTIAAEKRTDVAAEAELKQASAADVTVVSMQAAQAEPKVDPDFVAGTRTGIGSTDQTNASHNRFIVVIDPGHQERANLEKEPVGPGGTETKVKVTGGTTGVTTGKPEYQLTLEASLVLGELLESRGIEVIFTRTTHDVNLSNRERAEIANQNNADLFIRIHADGSNDHSVRGLSVLTPAENNPYTASIYEDSLKASQLIIDETKTNASVKVNGVSYRGDLSGFNWAKVPSSLVEMGFMSNPDEDKNLSDPAYLKNLLTNVADGIVEYAGFKGVTL
jgi:N-acetylmuramoyl-L-alanine amidase